MARLTMKDEHSGMDILVLEEERLLSSKGFIDKDEMYKIMRHLAEKLFVYEDLEEKIHNEINRIVNENYVEVDKYNTLIWVLEQLK